MASRTRASPRSSASAGSTSGQPASMTAVMRSTALSTSGSPWVVKSARSSSAASAPADGRAHDRVIGGGWEEDVEGGCERAGGVVEVGVHGLLDRVEEALG